MDGVWVFIGADSVIFAILFMSFMQDRLKNPALFEASRQTLNMHLGGIDTLILLTRLMVGRPCRASHEA